MPTSKQQPISTSNHRAIMNQPPQKRSRISGATNEIIPGRVEGQVRIGAGNRIYPWKSYDTDNRAMNQNKHTPVYTSELPHHREHSSHITALSKPTSRPYPHPKQRAVMNQPPRIRAEMNRKPHNITNKQPPISTSNPMRNLE